MTRQREYKEQRRQAEPLQCLFIFSMIRTSVLVQLTTGQENRAAV